jgi:hypothetical protein
MQNIDATRILDALASLSSKNAKVFGANGHSFRLAPALPEASVNEFERVHGVSLPSDFRQFLIHVGNGGAGPFYGLFPLDKIDGPFGFEAWPDGLIGILSEPFPIVDDWNDLSGMPTRELADRDKSEYYRQYEVFDTNYWRASLVNGAIPICDEGCALRVLLVVTGREAGFLWEDRRSEYGGLKRLRLADGSPATFARCYEEWLNSCLATL